MRNFIVLGFGLDDLLGRLFVAKFAGLGNDGDVSGWVHFFEDHLDLVKDPESETPFLLHDFINSPAVILDFQSAKRWLQLFKVHHEVGSCISKRVKWILILF